ncbi:MAG: hypothetical protein H6719_06875 [Sandaracinaceae bacterium]|nr:hypothetical protein [Sandaracinaceae bacterium]
MSREPAWKSLVDQLVDDGYESPHLDRLRARYDVYQRATLGRASLEVEILEEMAHALGRAEEKVDVALLELALAGRRCDRAGNDAASVEAFNAARRRALAVRRDLQIHREALRFPRDPRFVETYPIPPARTSTG